MIDKNSITTYTAVSVNKIKTIVSPQKDPTHLVEAAMQFKTKAVNQNRGSRMLSIILAFALAKRRMEDKCSVTTSYVIASKDFTH